MTDKTNRGVSRKRVTSVGLENLIPVARPFRMQNETVYKRTEWVMNGPVRWLRLSAAVEVSRL